jgi:integrase/recombinase XerD
LDKDEFEKWLFSEGKADKTIESYVSDVKLFQFFLQEKLKDIPVLSRFSFVRYKEHLMKKGMLFQRSTKRLIA